MKIKKGKLNGCIGYYHGEVPTVFDLSIIAIYDDCIVILALQIWKFCVQLLWQK